MAVPSSGELSLTGIALEMIQNKYQSKVTLSPGQSSQGQTLLAPAPEYPAPGGGGFYSPIYALQGEDVGAPNLANPAYITRETNPDGDSPFMLVDAATTRAISDISLAGMSGMTEGQSMVAGAQSADGGPDPPYPGGAPITKAHQRTYLSTNPGGFLWQPSGASTIMYTIYRGGSNGSGTHVVGAYVYSGGNAPPVVGSNQFVYVDPVGTTSDGGPTQEFPMTSTHPAPIGINTANPTANRPQAPPSPVGGTAMSEFYSYDHDYVAPATTGVHFGPALFSGNGGTSLYTYNIDLADPTYAGGPVQSVGDTQYLIFAYKNGVNPPPSTPPRHYNGDVQVTTFSVNGTMEPFGSPYPSAPTEKWFTTTMPAVATSVGRAATTAGAGQAYNDQESVIGNTAVPSPSNQAGRWNHKPSGKGPSGQTGVSDPTGFIYAETSSPSAYGTWFIARLQVSFTSDSVQVQLYRKGENVGSMFVGVDLQDACFVMGTLITMYDGTYKPIEEIQVGDIVFTQVGEEEVLRTLSPVHSDIVEYTFSDGTKTKNTSDHPYYVIDKGWCSNSPILTNQRYDIETEEFVCGDVCINDNDEQIELVGIEKLDGDFQTYTFSTNSKTYYANKLLVHSEI
tara:strand:- start:2180 stop:4045 length:1866 start_codon:yes stop_codon:yes gene_type:complete